MTPDGKDIGKYTYWGGTGWNLQLVKISACFSLICPYRLNYSSSSETMRKGSKPICSNKKDFTHLKYSGLNKDMSSV